MFEVLANDRFDFNGLTYPFYARTQTADTPHDELNFCALRGGIVKSFDDIGVNKRVHFSDDVALGTKGGFVVYHGDDAVFNLHGRHGKGVKFAVFGKP